jgi:DNA transposition AAA+ family ATPase
MPERTNRVKVTDQLRKLIRDSGVTCSLIADETGVSDAALSRFLSGERGLSAKALDKLGDYFGWQVVAKPQADAKGSKQTR